MDDLTRLKAMHQLLLDEASRGAASITLFSFFIDKDQLAQYITNLEFIILKVNSYLETLNNERVILTSEHYNLIASTIILKKKLLDFQAKAMELFG